MKIATLTLPLHTNYGGVLQAWALQKTLNQLGHSSDLINISGLTIKSALRAARKKFKQALLWKLVRKKSKTANPHFEKFIQEEIRRTPAYDFAWQLNDKNLALYDALIVGSDQVWRPEYAINLELFFFNFIRTDKILLSYAASFGKDDWQFSPRQTQNCRKLIKHFKGVSVREKAGVDLCRQYLNTEAIRVMDPTLLIDTEQYRALIAKYCPPRTQNSRQVFGFLLDWNQANIDLARAVSSRMEARLELFNQGRNIADMACIGQWLARFNEADFVVTDSFHGVAFSLLFNKPFMAITNEDRGANRFDTILELFNLEHRRVGDGTTDLDGLLDKKIDFHNVNQILNTEKKRAIQFLHQLL